MSKTAQIESVTLHFDLFDLPTAQHKAGLAGLLLQIDDMTCRKLESNDIPLIVERSATSATIEFTERSVQSLMNETYAARIAEAASTSKWAGKTEPKRIDEIEVTDPKTKKKSKTKRFIYDVIQPDAPLMRRLYNDPDNSGPWLKLWRKMIWDVPRGKPASRRPFNQCAEDEPTAEGGKAWTEMHKLEKDRTKGVVRTTSISGTQLLGAQDINAEGVDFVDRSKHAFLLHFWMFTLRIFVPAKIENDGKSEFVGYSLAIPEISNLEIFCDAFPESLADLGKDLRGYRPRDSIVDLPAEAALQFMMHMAQVVSAKSGGDTFVSEGVSSIEFLHLVKLGNNIKLMSAGRVSPNPNLLADYQRLVGGDFRNPLFRSGLLHALLNQQEWYAAFDRILVERPWPLFVRSDKTPGNLPSFGADVRKRFLHIQSNYEETLKDYPMNDKDDSQTAPVQPIELLIHRLVATYVREKTEAKSGMKWEDFKHKKKKDERTGKERIAIPKPYSEAKAKIAADAYLAMRSRREQEFADYFTASICSVAQFLKKEEYQLVANTLLNDPAKIKTLSLLSLSANS